MFLALESRLALWLLLLKEYGRRDVTSVSRPGFVTLATSTSCFLEALLWEKPATVWEIQMLRPSHCQEVGPGYFESPHGERRPARARHSSHLKPGSRHVSEKKAILDVDKAQGSQPELRPQSALSKPTPAHWVIGRGPSSHGGEGGEEPPLPSLPDFLSHETASANDFRFHH